MKKILITLLIINASFASANERDDINQVLKEVTYIKEAVTQLKKKHRNTKNKKFQFNYDAMLSQLSAIQNGTRQYLNYKISELHFKPPKPVIKSQVKVRRN